MAEDATLPKYPDYAESLHGIGSQWPSISKNEELNPGSRHSPVKRLSPDSPYLPAQYVRESEFSLQKDVGSHFHQRMVGQYSEPWSTGMMEIVPVDMIRQPHQVTDSLSIPHMFPSQPVISDGEQPISIATFLGERESSCTLGIRPRHPTYMKVLAKAESSLGDSGYGSLKTRSMTIDEAMEEDEIHSTPSTPALTPKLQNLETANSRIQRKASSNKSNNDGEKPNVTGGHELQTYSESDSDSVCDHKKTCIDFKRQSAIDIETTDYESDEFEYDLDEDIERDLIGLFAKHKVIEKMMQYFYAKLDTVIALLVRSCTNSQTGESSHGDGGSQNIDKSTYNSRKRKANDGNGLFPDDENRGGESFKRHESSTDVARNEQRFACPLYKYNRHEYCVNRTTKARIRSCAAPGFRTIAQVKQHIRIVHPTPYQCSRCWAVQNSLDELSYHSAPADCEARSPRLALVTADQMRLIHVRGMTWEKIFAILFPGCPVPSPYCEEEVTSTENILNTPSASSKLPTFNSYAQKALPVFVTSCLSTGTTILEAVNKGFQILNLSYQIMTQADGVINQSDMPSDSSADQNRAITSFCEDMIQKSQSGLNLSALTSFGEFGTGSSGDTSAAEKSGTSSGSQRTKGTTVEGQEIPEVPSTNNTSKNKDTSMLPDLGYASENQCSCVCHIMTEPFPNGCPKCQSEFCPLLVYNPNEFNSFNDFD